MIHFVLWNIVYNKYDRLKLMSLQLVARRGGFWCTTQRCPAILITGFAGGAVVHRPSALTAPAHYRKLTRACVNARAVHEPDQDRVMLENNCEPSTARRFFGCYLLASQSPKAKERTYIGYCMLCA